MKLLYVLCLIAGLTLVDAITRVDPGLAIPGFRKPCMQISADESSDAMPFVDNRTAFLFGGGNCSDTDLAFYYDSNMHGVIFHILTGNLSVTSKNFDAQGVEYEGLCEEDTWYVLEKTDQSTYSLLAYKPLVDVTTRHLANLIIPGPLNIIFSTFYVYPYPTEYMFECDAIPLRPSQIELRNPENRITFVGLVTDRESSEIPNSMVESFEFTVEVLGPISSMRYFIVRLPYYNGESAMFIHFSNNAAGSYGESGYVDKPILDSDSFEIRLNPLSLLQRHPNGTEYVFFTDDGQRKIDFHAAIFQLDIDAPPMRFSLNYTNEHKLILMCNASDIKVPGC
ncbi:hypothetical protein CAPTEDRAFT_193929 [Capitella teleta]|uniref:Uncharacterized protein n=1 Tax=Capitella teleta TaxID=283909 RepID=R7TQR9_CAPTE|nr:hypothetical protein CAPTEDRAFT_193929 [Capitella teleta]|eukprot:ELT93826.1 hypothetical protein CAPTEDRAFT_193929 [Capitella teleta]